MDEPEDALESMENDLICPEELEDEEYHPRAVRIFQYTKREDIWSVWWSGWTFEPMIGPHGHYSFIAEWMCDGSCNMSEDDQDHENPISMTVPVSVIRDYERLAFEKCRELVIQQLKHTPDEMLKSESWVRAIESPYDY